ncbi:tetratricopeptide repeat protein, partial [Psychrobacter sp. I-STPA10]|uniref:tetratricopeptide repeat protein n=1 Tax=Psychrobacter sp. I-STPA10 TaxID=2585769 RepID=UPI001E512341
MTIKIRALALSISLISSSVMAADEVEKQDLVSLSVEQLTTKLQTAQQNEKDKHSAYLIAEQLYQKQPNEENAQQFIDSFIELSKVEQQQYLKSYLPALAQLMQTYSQNKYVTSLGCWSVLLTNQINLAKDYCQQAYLSDYASPADIINLAHIQAAQGNMDTAKQMYNQSLAMAATQGNGEDFVTEAKQDFVLLDNIYTPVQAEEYQKYMVLQWQQVWLNYQQLTSQRNQAYQNQEWKQGFTIAQQQQDIIKQQFGEESLYYADIIEIVANYHQRLGQYKQALPLYQKSLAIFEKVLGEEYKSTATSYNNLASLYETLGDYNKALSLYQKSLAIREKVLGEDHPDTASSYNNLAFLYNNLGDYDKALPLYQKSLAISEKVFGEVHQTTATIYTGLAGKYQILGYNDIALILFQRALEIHKKILGEEHPNTAFSYDNLAGIYEVLGKYNQAVVAYQHALEIREKVFGTYDIVTASSYNNLAVLHSSFDRLLAAHYYAMLSHKLYIFNLESIFANQRKQAFIKTNSYYTPLVLKTAHSLIQAQADKPLQPTAEELKYTPELKAITNTQIHQDTLNAWLNSKGALYDNENMLAMLRNNSKYLKIANKIDEITQQKQYLTDLYKQLLNSTDNRKIDPEQTTEQINQAQSKIADLESQLAAQADSFRIELGLKNISSQQIADTLTADQLYIDFAHTEDGYYIFTLDHNNHITFERINNSSQIDKLTHDLQNSIQDTQTQITSINNNKTLNSSLKTARIHQLNNQMSHNNQQYLQQLYQHLISDTKLNIDSKAELIISADGALRLLPFDALIDPQGQYLIQSHRIRYIPSGKEWLRLHKQPKHTIPNKDLTIFYNPDYHDTKHKDEADNRQAITRNTDISSNTSLRNLTFNDLPGTQQEAEDIIATLKQHQGKIQSYSREQANKDNLLQTKDSKLLHIASHGFFINDPEIDNPMLKSGIALTGATANSYTGKVTALDLMGIQLDGTDMVVLSAC